MDSKRTRPHGESFSKRAGKSHVIKGQERAFLAEATVT